MDVARKIHTFSESPGYGDSDSPELLVLVPARMGEDRTLYKTGRSDLVQHATAVAVSAFSYSQTNNHGAPIQDDLPNCTDARVLVLPANPLDELSVEYFSY